MSTYAQGNCRALESQKRKERIMPEELTEGEARAQFDALPEDRRESMIRKAGLFFPASAPERQRGEGEAGWLLRCQQETADRRTILEQRAIAA